MHDHSHHHHGDESTNRIAWAFFLNLGFSIVEFVGGWLTNSTAIMADAVHDLGDSLSIGSAWLLNKLGKKEADVTFTYGYRRLSLFGALINGVVLVSGSIWVLSEAIPRLFNPVMPMAEGMFWLAILGVLVNGFAAYRLSHGETLNERVLNWHLMEDVLGWIAVLIVSVVLYFFEVPILDPVLCILFTLFILFNVVKHLRTTLMLFAQSVPDPELRDNVYSRLSGIQHINEIWSLDGERHVLTAHLVLDYPMPPAQQIELKEKIAAVLKDYKLQHTTIELEYPDEICRDND